MTFTFGSLFSGIGGIDLGLERAGMRCIWQVENDPYAQKVLHKHWPNTPRYGDIRTVDGSALARVALVAGGFPCQDISSSGKRAGITGERSGLWKEFARLICELRPRYVLVENVAALLYPLRKKRRIIEPAPIGVVLGELAACGYDAEWQILSAASVGAPHLRERCFIVAYAASSGLEEQQSAGGLHDESDTPGHDVSDPTGNGRSGRQLQPLTRQHERSAIAGQDGHGQPVANATGDRWHAWRTEREGQQRALRSEWSSASLSNANRSRLAFREVFGGNAPEELATIARACSTGRGQWATEPGIRRVAHGVPHRMERLTGLGNAVVPQVAEYIGRLILAHATLET